MTTELETNNNGYDRTRTRMSLTLSREHENDLRLSDNEREMPRMGRRTRQGLITNDHCHNSSPGKDTTLEENDI